MACPSPKWVSLVPPPRERQDYCGLHLCRQPQPDTPRLTVGGVGRAPPGESLQDDCDTGAFPGAEHEAPLFPSPSALNSFQKSWKPQRPNRRAETNSSFIVPGKVSDNRGLPREAKAHITLTKFNKARPADSTSCLRGAWRFKA